MANSAPTAFLERIADQARDANVFEHISVRDEEMVCAARDVESDANYRVDLDHGQDCVWVGLYTPDRWLSESIEGDLMFRGDKLEELLEDELAEQGHDGPPPEIEHFRDDAMRYVFRSAVDRPPGQSMDGMETARSVARLLLAYEATFRQLGDMSPTDELP